MEFGLISGWFLSVQKFILCVCKCFGDMVIDDVEWIVLNKEGPSEDV